MKHRDHLEELVQTKTNYLRQSEEKFSKAFRNAPLLMSISSADDGRFLEVNDAFVRVTGYSRERVVGSTSVELGLITSEGRRDMMRVLDAGGRVQDMELDLKRADGSNITCLYSCEAIEVEGRRRLLSIVSDITEQKQAEAALRESEARLSEFNQLLSGILSHTHMMAVFLDTRFNFIWVNQAYADTGKQDPSFFQGKNHFDLYPHEDNQRIFQQVVDTGEPSFMAAKPFEFPDQPERGITYWDWGLVPVINDTGDVTGLVFTLAEVTERVRAEQALRESEERFRLVFHTSPDSINLNRLKDGLYIDINEGFTNILGYTRDDVIGKTSVELNIWKHSQDRKRLVDALKKQGYAENLEAPFVGKDGRVRYGLMSARTLRLNDENIIVSITRDITKRKQAEEALREREEAYQALVEGLPDIVMRFDRDGRHLFASDQVEKAVGIPASAFIGKTHRDLGFPEPICAFWEESIRRVFNTGAPFETEFAVEGLSGEIIFNWRIMPEFDARGHVRSALSISRDMTAHRKAERDYRTLFREMLDGFALHEIICDDAGRPVDYRFLAVNPAFEKMTGLDAGHVLGRTVLEVLPGTEACWIRTYGSVALTGEPLVFENYTKDLDRFFKVTAFRPARGQFACIFQDITDLKRAEEALRKSEAMLAQSQRIARVGSWQLDVATGQLVWSDETYRIFGLEPQAFAATYDAFLEAVHPADRATVDAAYAGSLAEGKNSYEIEHRIVKKDTGEIRQVYEKCTHETDEYGIIIRSFGMVQDITERKKSEKERDILASQLHQSHKMQAIGTLAGGIAHDFNNILSVIVGNTELAMLDLPEWSPAQDSLKEVRHATLRARDLVRQILLFSRRKEDAMSSIRLEPIVRQTLKMLRASIPTTVEIREAVEEGLPSVLADPSQIQQVIMNLCTNAGQVMEAEGGTLTFALDSADLGAPLHTVADVLPPGRYVRMRVSDTGPGIPVDIVERIFDPFFTTKGVGEGTGLGLAVVHGILQDRKGGITVESEEGRGTTFTIYLPASDLEPVEGMAEQPRDLPRGTERILFADDEPMIRHMAQRMLERQGYCVETRAGGAEALESFRQDPTGFDLLVTDMTMPGMTGDRLAAEILAIRPDIPVILCTGYSRQISEEKARDMGIGALVMKPLTQHELANTVRRVLDET